MLSILLINLTHTSSVLFNDAPSGSVTTDISIPWSSSGINPVGITLNKPSINSTIAMYVIIVSFLS